MTRIIMGIILLTLPLYVAAQEPVSGSGNTLKRLNIGVVDQIYSDTLAEQRSLNIYLPEGYDPSGSVRYPVIYLLDGGTNEDFLHISGLVQYASMSWIKWLPPSIVVGIVNTDRKRDFTFPTIIPEAQKEFPTAGHSDRFISFMAQELQPYIDRHYKTNGNRTLIGQSLGGLLATEIVFKQPDLFQQYIIISPSLWWDEQSLFLQKPAVMSREPNTRIYIGVGKEGSTPGNSDVSMEADAHLLAGLLQEQHPQAQVYMDYLQDEDHATVMHQAVLHAFKWLGSLPQ